MTFRHLRKAWSGQRGTHTPSPPRVTATGVTVTVNNNPAQKAELPGYVILGDRKQDEPKTIDHADTPVVPAKSGNVGDAQRDARREAKELTPVTRIGHLHADGRQRKSPARNG